MELVLFLFNVWSKKKVFMFLSLSALPISDFFAFLPDIYMSSLMFSISLFLSLFFLSIWTLSLCNSHILVQSVSAKQLLIIHVSSVSSILDTTRKKSLKDFLILDWNLLILQMKFCTGTLIVNIHTENVVDYLFVQ